MHPELKTKLGSLHTRNPILTASGCYGYGEEYSDVADAVHLGGIVTKSISPVRWYGNSPPRLAETGTGLINSIGLANVGADSFKTEIAPRLKSVNTKIIVSIAGKTIDDYELVVQKLEDANNIDGYELNISCPNVKEGGMAFSQNPSITEKLVKRVRKLTKRWIAAKLTPNVTKISEGALAAEAGGADAVSLINTLVGMAVDYRSRSPKIATITGGYSGPPVKPIALAKVWEVYNAVKIPIIGIGGITTWQDVLEFMIVGASAVQIGTALFTDPQLPEKINKRLIQYLEEEEIGAICEIIGTLRTDRPYNLGVPG
ncbi:MAG: dihydroorotate dehydrogenase [Candidatus Electryonea clarkiae]|nr:dihydroorotate dehydrogenase [Candidatus Electryonea clarkiae]MDP8288090.1 dihydroorotate dehydrogenase [Candidatus Electryonea clarkiae]